jgi:hypothetical protein
MAAQIGYKDEGSDSKRMNDRRMLPETARRHSDQFFRERLISALSGGKL